MKLSEEEASKVLVKREENLESHRKSKAGVPLKRGRPRKFKNNAERQRDYRRRKALDKMGYSL
jgi:hypothetical protein